MMEQLDDDFKVGSEVEKFEEMGLRSRVGSQQRRYFCRKISSDEFLWLTLAIPVLYMACCMPFGDKS